MKLSLDMSSLDRKNFGTCFWPSLTCLKFPISRLCKRYMNQAYLNTVQHILCGEFIHEKLMRDAGAKIKLWFLKELWLNKFHLTDLWVKNFRRSKFFLLMVDSARHSPWYSLSGYLIDNQDSTEQSTLHSSCGSWSSSQHYHWLSWNQSYTFSWIHFYRWVHTLTHMNVNTSDFQPNAQLAEFIALLEISKYCFPLYSLFSCDK